MKRGQFRRKTAPSLWFPRARLCFSLLTLPVLTSTLTDEDSQSCILWPGWKPSSVHNPSLLIPICSISYQTSKKTLLYNKSLQFDICDTWLSKAQGSFLPGFNSCPGLHSSPEKWNTEQKTEAEIVLTLTRSRGQGLIGVEDRIFQYTEGQGLLNIEPKITSSPAIPHIVPRLAR